MAKDRTAGWSYVRAAGDVVQLDDGTWLLVSAEAVQFAQRNPQIFSSAKTVDSLATPVPLIPLAIDPPDHLRYRKILDPMLAPRVINAMEPVLRAQARALIEGFASRGQCEVIADLASLYPTQVFLTLFGLPLEDRDRFRHWAETIIDNANFDASADPAADLVECSTSLFGYLQGYVDEKRARPGDDMLSRVLSLTGDDAWSDQEVLGMCFLFVLAGLDTVTASIGFLLYHLARSPELRQRMVADPALVQPVIEEVLRLEQPAVINLRATTEAVEVCGVGLPSDAKVALCIATANRDGEKFASPHDIDLDQANTGHLAFGGGIHRCLGSHLARRELRIIAEEFHALIPDYSIAPGAEPEIVWPSGTFHLKELPLVFPPR